MRKRKEVRISKSLLVDISRRGLDQMGITVNISRRGMCIATTKLIRRRSRLRILLAADDNIYAVTGLVIWKSKRKDAQSDDAPVGLGIEIEKADPGYGRYVSSAKKMLAGSQRTSTRK
jgi:hypothetical protein